MPELGSGIYAFSFGEIKGVDPRAKHGDDV
jgi:hypothetical protein